MTGLARRRPHRRAPLPGGCAGRGRARRRRPAAAGRGGGAAPRGAGRAGRRPLAVMSPCEEPRRRAAAGDRRGARGLQTCSSRPTSRLALAHAGAQARDRTTAPAAPRCRPSPPTRSPGSWTRTSTSLRARSRAVSDLLTRRRRGARHVPARDRPAPGPQRPGGHPRRRRPHGAGRVRHLPCGEGFIAPCDGEGTVATRSLASIGLVQGHPAHLTIEGGHLHQGHRSRGRAPLRASSPAPASRARTWPNNPWGRHQRARTS